MAAPAREDVDQPPAAVPGRWRALGFIALAQLMITLDTTVVNIAMPSAQEALGLSDGDRQWVIAAYALAFGLFLLPGGRIGDLVGHRRAFLAGLGGFAVASAVGGAATSPALLLSARAAQGVCGGLLAPAALALVAITFTDQRERARAFGVYSAIAGGGAAVGLILGGVLTEYLSWRWSLYIGVPFALVAAVGAFGTVPAPPDRPAGTGGRRPLLPMGVVADRTRGGVYLALALSVMSMFALFLFMTYFLQVVRDYSPVRTGFAFLPIAVSMAVGSLVVGGGLSRRSPRAVMTGSLLVAALGVLLLTRLSVDSGYVTLVLPAGVLLGLGLGTFFVPATNLATLGVPRSDTGVASAMAVVAQQVGGAVGTVLLNGIAASATAAYLDDRGAPALGVPALGDLALGDLQDRAMIHGFALASWWTAGILLLSAVVTALMVEPGAGRAAPAPTPPPRGEGTTRCPAPARTPPPRSP
ncbi:MAG: hypothetical protein QG608_401 [Actinomycetota bacterium]|nr:hypothetical protein [Actinomycetota bacterium]